MVEALERYTIPVPEWCRTIWASADAKALWEPRLHRIFVAWSAAERMSVGTFRAACRQSVSPDEMAALSMKAAETGRTLLVLGKTAAGKTYAAGPTPLVPGEKWNYNVVLAESPEAARLFSVATANNDDAVMGDLLGFPPCCIAFFNQTWVADKWLDPTWRMSECTTGLAGGSSNFGRTLEFKGVTPFNNTLLRWLGVRLVPHLPCSHDCPGTTALGKRFGEILQAYYPEEYGWMLALLSARLQWSANKGIAEIATPVLKISTKTDALTAKVIVRLLGGDLEGQARGVVFPWKITNMPPSITPMVFRKPTDLHTHNGFNSMEAMETSHAVIRDFYQKHHSGAERLIDFGCGNGLLASKLVPKAEGVEADLERAAEAEARITVHKTTIIAFMRDSDAHYDVALISAERLLEMNDLNRTFALEWLKTHTAHVVLYTYSDGNLHTICHTLGLECGDVETRDTVHVGRLVQ